MEELKRAVAQVQAMETSMISTLGKLESMDKSIVSSLSKFIIISTFLIGIMTVHLTLFGVWSFFVSTQNNEIRNTVLTNRSFGEQRDTELQAAIDKLQTEQKALIEGTAENNYTIRSHNDESESVAQKMLLEIKSLVKYNQNLLRKTIKK